MKIKRNGTAAILFGLGAMIIYFIMVLGPLRYLTDLAMVRPFDHRPTGSSPLLLDTPGEAGRQTDLTWQIPLDML